MSLLDTLRKNLSSDLFTQVTDALGDNFNYDLVPRSRLNEVIGQRDAARTELERFTQSGKSFDSDDDDDDEGAEGDPPPKQKKSTGRPKTKGFTQADIDAAVEQAKQDGAAEMKNLRIRFAATEKLRAAGFIDPDLVFASSLIDLSKITLDDKGTITGGLDDQITEIAKARPYLVSTGDKGGAQKGTGKKGGDETGNPPTTKEEFLKLSTADQIAFKEANPDVFKGFMQTL